jgi:YD repeat-containing protein
MSTEQSFVSQATNFTSAVGGGVDPRTGLYNVTLQLGQVTGNRGIGPGLELTLQYSPLNRSNVGLGSGWALGLTTLQLSSDSSPVLCLSTGEQYGLTSTNGVYQVLQQKLQSFRLIPITNDTNHYWVVHKSGDRELIEIAGAIGYVKQLYTPAGHYLTLNWDTSSGTYALLTSVVDMDNQTLLQAANYGSAGVEYHFLNFSTNNTNAEAYIVDISLNGDMLDTLTIQADGCQDQKWTFTPSGNPVGQPQDKWGQWIAGFRGPGGYMESVDYTQLSHAMPTGAPATSMPCVSSWTCTPGGGQPDMVSTYTYSTFNFLGGGATIPWYPDRDSLMEVPYDPDPDSAYVYYSTETQTGGAGPNITITRTYNSLHLQTKTDTTSDGNTRTTVTAYQLQSAPVDGQSSQYQLPASKTDTWDDGSGSPNVETSTFTWDDFGNPLTRVDPDGVITRWNYYSEAGEGNLCPPEPNGFRRFVKWTQTDPTTVNAAAWITGSAPVQHTNYQYDTFYSINDDPKQTLVLLKFLQQVSAASTDGDGNLTSPTILSETGSSDLGNAKAFQYGSEQYTAGRLCQKTVTHYPDGNSDSGYDTIDQYDYQYLDSNDQNFPYGLQTTHTLTATGVDGTKLSLQDSQIVSVFTGRGWKQVDSQKNTTVYDFDGLGRQKTRILDPDDADHKNVLTYTYVIDDTGQTPFTVTQRDQRSNKVRYTMDGMRRTFRKEVNCIDQDGIDDNDDDDIRYIISQRTFDGAGRVATSISTDIAFETDGQQVYALTQTMAYDGWGHIESSTYSDGNGENPIYRENTTYDPVKKTVRSWRSSTQDTTVTGASLKYYDYNFSQKTYRTERYTALNTGAPYSTVYSTYDGLHRLRSETQQYAISKSATTTYDYDYWHRVQNTTLPEGSVVVRSYSPDSPEKRVTNIQVTQTPGDLHTLKSPGSRVFDALGRVTRKYLGEAAANRYWTYQYADTSRTRPTTAVDPEPTKPVRTYSYDDMLGEVVRSVQLSSVSTAQDFGFDFSTGFLNKASSTDDIGTTYTLNYDMYPSGRLLRETHKETELHMEYAYTVSGALHRYTHIDGTVQTIARDTYGRISMVSDGEVDVTPHYDGVNRLNGWTATNSSHTLTTDLGGYLLDGGQAGDYLDDFGREIKRVIKDSKTANTWIIKQTWQVNDLLAQRLLFLNGPLTEAEVFTYDVRNRLTVWDGTQGTTKDRYGNVMTKQTYTIDPLNNITNVVTNLKGTSSSTNTATFTFDDNDPCLLTGGTNTHPSYPASFTVTSDKAGRITDDGMGTTFGYDDLGRVKAAGSTLTTLNGTYTYDAHNRLATQSVDAQTTEFYYRANVLVNLIQGDNQTRLLQSPVGGPAAQTNTGTDAGSWLLGANGLGSVLNASDGVTTEQRIYSAYGEEPITAAS